MQNTPEETPRPKPEAEAFRVGGTLVPLVKDDADLTLQEITDGEVHYGIPFGTIMGLDGAKIAFLMYTSMKRAKIPNVGWDTVGNIDLAKVEWVDKDGKVIDTVEGVTIVPLDNEDVVSVDSGKAPEQDGPPS